MCEIESLKAIANKQKKITLKRREEKRIDEAKKSLPLCRFRRT